MLCAGCRPEADLAPRSVLVVSFDALRADALGPSDDGPTATPHLDDFAGQATRFVRAYSPSAKTPSSFAAYFTGRHATDALVDWHLPVDGSTLAETFLRSGHATAAFLNNPALRAERGFGRGFEHFEVTRAIDDAIVVDHALAWLETTRQPFFLWLHLIDPHTPWVPHAESVQFYRQGEATLQAGPMLPLLVLEDEAAMERARDLYRGEVHRVDRLFGEVLGRLESLGLSENTIVLVTSDHGEEMMEHGQLQHGALTEENIAIPVLLRVPGQRTARQRDTWRGIDLRPTLLALAGISHPDEVDEVDGVDALAQSPEEVVAVAHTSRQRQAASIRVGDDKLIVECEQGAASSRALYDLASDPDERIDRSHQAPARADALEARLWAAIRRQGCADLPMPRGIAPQLGREDRAALEALGYVGAEAGGEDD